jgi:hypothetical protein
VNLWQWNIELAVERSGTVNTGDAGGPLTAEAEHI